MKNWSFEGDQNRSFDTLREEFTLRLDESVGFEKIWEIRFNIPVFNVPKAQIAPLY
jgi:hypothetical protein